MGTLLKKDGSFKLYPQMMASVVLGVIDWFYWYSTTNSIWEDAAFYLADNVLGIFFVLVVGIINTVLFAPIISLLIITYGFEKVKNDERGD